MAVSHSVLDNSLPSGAVAQELPAKVRKTNWLRWRQWLVLFAMGALVIVTEMRNHANMWREHNSGQTIWTDDMLQWEIIFFGLGLPILAGITLEYMGRLAVERDRMARNLQLRRTLVGQLHRAQDWQQILDLIVAAPGTITMADRAWLLAQRSDEDAFDQVAYWERFSGGGVPAPVRVSPGNCAQCAASAAQQESKILTCHHPDLMGRPADSDRYCLWLSSAGERKAALLFDLPADHPLDSGQRKILDDLGDELSLAIDNANLRYIEQRQADAARNERLRIARDLHDTLGQNVSYLRLKLEQLNRTRKASDYDALQDELPTMLAVADEAYAQMRDTLDALRAADLLALEESVRLYADQVSARSGFSVDVQSSGQPGTFSPRQNRELMYIVREILNNVEKHAAAQHVHIQLRWVDSEFRMAVRDDGKGFLLQDPNRVDGYGMAIMAERSRAINADLAVESTPGSGTVVKVRVPLSASLQVVSGSQ